MLVEGIHDLQLFADLLMVIDSQHVVETAYCVLYSHLIDSVVIMDNASIHHVNAVSRFKNQGRDHLLSFVCTRPQAHGRGLWISEKHLERK